MWERVDGFYASIWRQPLRFLCGLTGKDNFFFARNIHTVGVILQCNTLLLFVILMNDVLITLFLGYIVLNNIMRIGSCRETIKKIEKDFYHQASNEVVALPVHPNFLLHRPKFMTATLVIAVIGAAATKDGMRIFMYAWGIGYIFEGIAKYWLTDIHPPKKSWLRKGLDSLIEAIKRIRIPMPSPAPSPAFSQTRSRL